MKNSGLDLEKYDALVQHVIHNDSTYITTEPFYSEIDENIRWQLNPSQLKLVR